MKKIFIGILATLFVLACSSKGAGEVIPRKIMAEIYADMFVADQWTNSNRSYRRTVDTTVIYEPIFQKYGYSADDYIASVDYYLNDPIRYERILQNALKIIEARQEVLEKARDEKEHQKMQAQEED